MTINVAQGREKRYLLIKELVVSRKTLKSYEEREEGRERRRKNYKER